MNPVQKRIVIIAVALIGMGLAITSLSGLVGLPGFSDVPSASQMLLGAAGMFAGVVGLVGAFIHLATVTVDDPREPGRRPTDRG